MFNLLKEYWLRWTTKEYWLIYSYNKGWLSFKDREEAIKSAFLNRSELYWCWWSVSDNRWIGQTDLELYEIDYLNKREK